MITNRDEPDIARLLDRVQEMPLATALIDRLEHSSEQFVIARDRAGLEWSVDNQIKGAANRARLKLFTPDERSDLVVLFAYKPSQISWSHDRYAYGAWEVSVTASTAPDTDEIDAWLRFQVSGFHPEHRPQSLVRMLSYDVPE